MGSGGDNGREERWASVRWWREEHSLAITGVGESGEWRGRVGFAAGRWTEGSVLQGGERVRGAWLSLSWSSVNLFSPEYWFDHPSKSYALITTKRATTYTHNDGEKGTQSYCIWHCIKFLLRRPTRYVNYSGSLHLEKQVIHQSGVAGVTNIAVPGKTLWYSTPPSPTSHPPNHHHHHTRPATSRAYITTYIAVL